MKGEGREGERDRGREGEERGNNEGRKQEGRRVDKLANHTDIRKL